MTLTQTLIGRIERRRMTDRQLLIELDHNNDELHRQALDGKRTTYRSAKRRAILFVLENRWQLKLPFTL